MSYDINGARIIDNYEAHPITVDNEGQATAQLSGLVAQQFAFAQGGEAFNSSFFGNTFGNVCTSTEDIGRVREPLSGSIDLTGREVRVRGAEVFDALRIPRTSFRPARL